MNKTKLTEPEKLERKLMRMFEKHFVNYNLNFALAIEPLQLYDSKNKYIGKREYYTNSETYLMFLAFQTGYLKGKK